MDRKTKFNRDMLPGWLRAYEFVTEPQAVRLGANAVLFHQGAAPNGVFLILAGGLSVHRQSADSKSIEIDKAYSGQFIGEMGAQSNQPRTATVVALVESMVLQLSSADYANILKKHTHLQKEMPAVTSERWKRLQLSGIVTNLFGDVTAADVHNLQDQLVWRSVPTGDMLCQQNEPADSMYVVVNGRLQFFTTDDDGQQNILGHAEAGETVGEFALITDQVRSATIRAVRESVIIEISKAQYQTLSQDYPQFAGNITKIIVERQLRSIGHLPQKTKKAQLNIAVVPTNEDVEIGRSKGSLTTFLSQLQTALETFGNTQIIHAQDLNDALGQPDIAQATRESDHNAAITQWLSEQENNADFLLFCPDNAWSMWTQRCIGQADTILLVGQPSNTAQGSLSDLETQINLQNFSLNKELVLWHPANTQTPKNTRQWLEKRPLLKRHYHVRDTDTAHFQRLARTLTGNGIGLVFSGGGARGFVDIGVIQAMRELNIPIDHIGGASFGALMAGVGAMGYSTDKLLEMSAKFSDPKFTQDRTFPIVAMNKSEGLVQMAKNAFGDTQIEDLWIPYFAVATNLSTAQADNIQRGPLWLAVRKSIAVPGVYTPIFEDGNIIVDGGVINNFPIDVMADFLNSNRIIGVSVSALSDKKRDYDIGPSVSGWGMLFEKLNPFAKKRRLPSLSYILLRTMEINSIQSSRESVALADLIMVITAKKHGFLAFNQYADIIKVGYEESLPQLREWKDQQGDL